MRSHTVLPSLLLGFALLAAAPLQAGVNRWTSIGPYGGHITALAYSANGRTAWAATKKLGVFRSADNGRTWTAANSGLSGEVVDLAASPAAPGRVYAATSFGVFRSDDAGLSWTAANTDLPAVDGKVNARLLATEPTEPAAVWVALPKQRALYRSTNLGARWRYVGWGLKGVVLDVAAHPKTAGVVFAATNQGLFRSADSGDHWSPAGLRGLEVSGVFFDRVQPRHLYAVTVREASQSNLKSRVFVSDDGGASWKEGSQQPPAYGNFELATDPAHAGTAWLSAPSGFYSVFKTTDGGQHWQSVLESDRSSPLALAANPLRPGTVLAGQWEFGTEFTSGQPAVFRTDDGGNSWSPSDFGIAAQIMVKVLPDPSKPGALYAQGCCSLWKRTGAGQPFTPFFSPAGLDLDLDGDPLFFRDLLFDPKTPSTLYLVARRASSYLYKSLDTGATWQRMSSLYLTSNFTSIYSIILDPAHPSTLYGVEVLGKRIYRSDDGGSSWNALRGSEGFYNAQVTVTGTAVYADGYEREGSPYLNSLRRSTDRGTTWTTLLELNLHARVRAVAEDPRDPQRLWTAFVESSGRGPDTGGIYRSTDGGAHWSLSHVAGNRPVFALAVDPRTSNRVWAASTGAVFLSEDGGTTWVSFSEGLPSFDVRDLRLDPHDPDTLYAGTDGGSVYELTRRTE
jgi:photosystem II stability/assembly factor-like uncharacterized protein